MSVASEESVANWESEFDGMVAEESDLRAAGRWLRGPQDLLSVIGRRRNELTHTAALAWLLDPIGAHGLGTAPLSGLLELIGTEGLGDDVLGWCRPAREVGIEGTFADLVIDGPGLRLVFEVKVDAPEGAEQAERLVRHFDAEDALFVFLTLGGGLPRTAGAHLDRWSAVSWSQVLTMLDGVRDRSAPIEGAMSSVDAYLDSLRRIA